MSTCRWCAAPTEIVLDLGEQPAADHFPLRTDPCPDPAYPLAMALCPRCGLAQLAEDATTPDEPRAVEPAALREQAVDAVARMVREGLVRHGARVREFGSPHGGSWEAPLREAGLTVLHGLEGPADVVVDVFGLMHAADQRAAFAERVAAVAPGGVLLVQFHTLAAILAHGTWNALRHGHVAYYSTPAVVGMLAKLGFAGAGAWRFDLYGGTVLLAFRAAPGTGTATAVAELAGSERAAGVLRADAFTTLQAAADTPALRDFLAATPGSVLSYGAASRTAALLQRSGVGPDLLPAVADASPAKQGRALPGSRIPIISPDELVAADPDHVVLFVADLLDEVRAALPQVRSWVVLDPELTVVGR